MHASGYGDEAASVLSAEGGTQTHTTLRGPDFGFGGCHLFRSRFNGRFTCAARVA